MQHDMFQKPPASGPPSALGPKEAAEALGLSERLLYTRKEAAELLGLKEGTLRTWASLGRGPRYKKLHGGPRAGVRYSADELRAYAEDPAAYERHQSGH
jgi:hypothetical protein